MKLRIHDVGMGQFITLEHQSGSTFCWDAGSSDSFQPGDYLQGQGISTVQKFIITNFDQDHVSGILNLRENVQVSSLLRNKKANAAYIRKLKLENPPVTDAMENALSMHETWNSPASEEISANPDGVVMRTYSCEPSEHINDTNNLSLVTILECSGQKFVISGDLERKGWQKLIDTTSILEAIKNTHVFVASHHGRENGYHEAVLSAASPACVVMSDYEVKHATQDTLGLYRKHCSGVTLNGNSRRVLTTRSDGSLYWDQL